METFFLLTAYKETFKTACISCKRCVFPVLQVRKIRIRFSQKRKDEEDNREMKIQERRKSVVEEKSQEVPHR